MGSGDGEARSAGASHAADSIEELAERYEAVASLRLAHDRYRSAYLAAPFSISITSLKTGKLVDVNDGTVELFGYSRDELLGASTGDLYADISERMALVDKVERDGKVTDFSARIRRKDGGVRDLSVSATMLDMAGEPMMLAIGIDVTEQRRMQEALAASESKYAIAFAASPVSVTLTDLKSGTIVDANEGTVELLGFSAEELLGNSTFSDLGIWPYPEERVEINTALRRDGRVEDFAIHLRRKDGRILDAVVSAVIMDVDGRTLMLAATRDVTEDNRLQEALRESERKYAAAFHTLPDAAVISRLSDGLFLAVNEGFTRQLGWTADEALGTTAVAIGAWDDKARRDDLVAGLREDGQVRDLEATIRRKDGTPTDALVSASMMEIGGEECALVMYRDITERKAIETALRESEERYRLIFGNVADAVYVHEVVAGQPGRFIDVNDGACAMLGYDKDEFLAMNVSDIDVPEQLEHHAAIVDRILRAGGAQFETWHVAKDGRHIPVEINTRLFEIAGKPTVLSVVRDVTERKAAEAAAEAYTRHLSELALELAETEERERRHLAESLHDRVSQVLAAASIRLGQAAEDPGRPDIEAVAAAKELVSRAIVESRSITEELAQPALYELGLGEGIKWHAERIREIHGVDVGVCVSIGRAAITETAKMAVLRAARELLANAARHSGAPGASVTVTAPGPWVELIVADDGAGFDPEAIHWAPGEGGFGLLSIRERVVSLGGTFDVRSAPGEGTTVTVRVPRRVS